MEFDGTFWLPSQPDNRVLGRLSLSGPAPTLALTEAVLPMWQHDTTQPNAWIPRPVGPDHEALTIHGEARGLSQAVSLLDCYTVGYTFEGQRLTGGYCLIGGHTSADTRFSSARFRLRYLDDWAELPGLSATDTEDRKEIVWERSEPLRVELPALGCWLELVAEVGRPRLGLRGGSLQHIAELRLVGLPNVVLRDVWWAVAAIKELLTLAIQADCRPTQLRVLDSVSQSWLTVIDPRIDSAAAGQVQVPSRILLTRQHMGLKALATWTNRYDDLRPIPAIVAGVVGAEQHVLESELFELASAAEGLHRRLDKAEKTAAFTKAEARAVREAAASAAGSNDELRRRVSSHLTHIRDVSYTERLGALLELAGAAMPGLNDWEQADWKERIRQARDGVAHQLPSYRNTDWEDRWREETALLNSLRWILTTLLLLEAGVEPTALHARLSQHQRFVIFRQQAREWLPYAFVRDEPSDTA
ncbi:hypothetical protein GCM10010169_19640 [Micromonospora fulviviridis]|uniref:ApeA N-terminal domain 1-containing protein n=1 Tax=Micromonospora fulviviridis TaxID=47860 RepID=UPI001666BC06|nr:HEPN domain-containing protein [Micromonospora fulviviridis]GGR75634.1 hypothetical protein GCM10010169_19640 [Micromonospora fulviviridis]